MLKIEGSGLGVWVNCGGSQENLGGLVWDSDGHPHCLLRLLENTLPLKIYLRFS